MCWTPEKANWQSLSRSSGRASWQKALSKGKGQIGKACPAPAGGQVGKEPYQKAKGKLARGNLISTNLG